MRITVLTQLAKGLRVPPELSATLAAELQRLKWFLWHGNVFRSLQTVDDIAADLEDEDTGGQQDKDRHDKLAKAVREFGGYLAANASAIPNYGERYRAGEIISTSFVESAVNQVISKRMVKKQQTRWSPEARTYCSRSAPGYSTTPSPTTTDAGTPTSPTPPTGRTKPRSLPRFVPLSHVCPADLRALPARRAGHRAVGDLDRPAPGLPLACSADAAFASRAPLPGSFKDYFRITAGSCKAGDERCDQCGGQAGVNRPPHHTLSPAGPHPTWLGVCAAWSDRTLTSDPMSPRNARLSKACKGGIITATTRANRRLGET